DVLGRLRRFPTIRGKIEPKTIREVSGGTEHARIINCPTFGRHILLATKPAEIDPNETEPDEASVNLEYCLFKAYELPADLPDERDLVARVNRAQFEKLPNDDPTNISVFTSKENRTAIASLTGQVLVAGQVYEDI